MHSVTENRLASTQHVQEVGSKFITLYNRVLNNYPEHLFQFYGSDSTVVVCDVKEDGQTETTKAESAASVRELLYVLYDRMVVVVRSCTPQSSSNGCISLLISGAVQPKDSNESRAYTQALILSRQSDGYYVKTDTTLVFPLGNGMPGSQNLMPSPLYAPGMVPGMAETPVMRNPTTTVTASSQSNARNQMINGGVNIPLTETVNVAPHIGLGGGSGGYSQRMNGHIEPALTQNAGKGGEGQTRGTTVAHDERTKVASLLNRTACSVMSKGKDVVSAYRSADIAVRAGADGCASPVSAPGALVSSLAAEGLGIDFPGHPHLPISLQPSPRIIQEESFQRNTTECKQLFACKLPLGSTVEEVTSAFAQYGPLSDSDPVRVFTGPDNCYACVTYVTESDMQKALGAQVQVGNKTVVTDVWRPRDRRPKRRRADNSHEQRAIATAN